VRIAQAFTACDAYAAHHATGKASAQCARILGFIAANSSIDWSIGELAHFLSMEKSTVSARLRELLDAGQLEPKTHRKDRRSGIKIRPVGLPAVGQLEMFQ
jgi:DNA-binding MarR family transcriptional regulator